MKAKNSLTLVKLCCVRLDEKKAEDLRVLDVSGQSSITDYLILATATSETHLRALRVELEKVLDEAKAHIVGIETAQESGWTVVDAFDLMLHLFTRETRGKYRLENLWKDAVDLPISKLLAAPVKAAKKIRKPKAGKTRKKPGKRP
jgi:ribosome-associated protein